jgi:hypothetical protein
LGGHGGAAYRIRGVDLDQLLKYVSRQRTRGGIKQLRIELGEDKLGKKY